MTALLSGNARARSRPGIHKKREHLFHRCSLFLLSTIPFCAFRKRVPYVPRPWGMEHKKAFCPPGGSPAPAGLMQERHDLSPGAGVAHGESAVGLTGGDALVGRPAPAPRPGRAKVSIAAVSVQNLRKKSFGPPAEGPRVCVLENVYWSAGGGFVSLRRWSPFCLSRWCSRIQATVSAAAMVKAATPTST